MVNSAEKREGKGTYNPSSSRSFIDKVEKSRNGGNKKRASVSATQKKADPKKTEVNVATKKVSKKGTKNSGQLEIRKTRYSSNLEKAAKQIQTELFEHLEFLNIATNGKKMDEGFYVGLERILSQNRDLYLDKEERTRIAANALEVLIGKTTDNDICKAQIRKYIDSPFGIFDFILEAPASDIFLVQNKICLIFLSGDKPVDIVIPNHLLATWYKFVDRFVTLTTYASDIAKTKFDQTNAILDYECDKVRFNVVHKALSAVRDNRPIIALRTQLLHVATPSIEASHKFTKNWFNGQKHLTATQKDFLLDVSFSKNFLFCGSTSSGKTVGLRALSGYRIEDKSNVITIEDTPELFLPVNIAYLTNYKFNIRDLFTLSLRESPSQIIIGETRSSEIVNILESGLVFKCATTIHASSFEKVIMRILFLAKTDNETNYTTKDIMTLITTVMDCFIFMKDRKVAEIWKRKDNIDDWSDTLHNYELVK